MRKRPSDRIHDVIEGEISGKHRGAWRLDSFGADESHEVRFRKGDNQAALWEIYDCTKAGKRVSGWAASAFRRLFMKVVAGQLTWSEAFGKIPERGQRRRVQTDAWLADVCGAFIQEVKAGAKIDNALFKKIGKDTGAGSSTTVKGLLKKGERAGLIQRRIRG
jgi:hypothetical protein